ncbi:MAG: insulinase family protein [Polyangiaceae bacterium]|nr:insulinase family protein [Polyangiaceae bacterium]
MPSQSQVQHVATVPFGPAMKVERFVLGNGLQLLVLVDPSAPVVCIQTWFGVGSRHEKLKKTGISHLFEHLMFGATGTKPMGAFDRLLEEAGAETNAATFLDWTYYHTNAPKDALELTISLEADRMANLVLNEPEVRREKEVVMNERRQRVEDDVEGAVNERLYKEAFLKHGYGWPTIGWMEDIAGMTTEDCQAFYKTYYAPNNARLVVVGDVNLTELVALVDRYYGPLPSAEIPIEDVHPESPQIEERRVEMRKPTPTQKVAIGYKSPALGDFDHAPLGILNEALFGGRASRVHRALIQQLEIATDVRGWVGAFRDPSLWDISLTARGEHTCEELLEAVEKIFDEVRTIGVTQAEVDRAQARSELGVLQSLETVAGKAEQIGFYDTVLGDPAAQFERLAQLRRVTRGDVLRVARRYLVNTARTMVLVRPDGSDGEGESEETIVDDDESASEAA